MLGTGDAVGIRQMWFQSSDLFSVREQTLVTVMTNVPSVRLGHIFSRVRRSRLTPLVTIFYTLED